jgi:hypothetical protein
MLLPIWGRQHLMTNSCRSWWTVAHLVVGVVNGCSLEVVTANISPTGCWPPIRLVLSGAVAREKTLVTLISLVTVGN